MKIYAIVDKDKNIKITQWAYDSQWFAIRPLQIAGIFLKKKHAVEFLGSWSGNRAAYIIKTFELI